MIFGGEPIPMSNRSGHGDDVRRIITFAALALMSATPVAADEANLQGFHLGSSLSEAQQYAVSRGWSLRRLSADLPGEWTVQETGLGLFVCDGKVAAVRKSVAGGVDEFAASVAKLRKELGEPKTEIAAFPAGTKKISNITASFDQRLPYSVSVQLSSTDGHLAIGINYSRADICGG